MGNLFLEVQEVIRMTADPLFSGGVLHGGVAPVDGHWSDAVLGVGEVGADLETKPIGLIKLLMFNGSYSIVPISLEEELEGDKLQQ